MRRPSLVFGGDRSRIIGRLRSGMRPPVQTEFAGIWVLSPLLLPLPKYGMVRRFNGMLFAKAARFWSRRLGFESPTLINYSPVLGHMMYRWPWRKVYHCVDRWDAFAMYDAGMMVRMDEMCCRSADVVIASARDLSERCRTYNANTHLIMHGVDYEHFAKAVGDSLPRPVDLPEGKIVGFVGLLSEWVDQDLLVRLAAELRDVHIVLIGKADVGVSKLNAVSNIHILGPKPFAGLPAYIAHFDVGIIPFIVNDLTRAVNPIKLREMLAAGCPVVSTALPEVERLSGRCEEQGDSSSAYLASLPSSTTGVCIAHTGDEFVKHVKALLEHPLTKEQQRRISGGMKEETWEVKVEEILRLIA
jgi:glycosyltransferase involved in cell wall biosynthesis